MSAGASEAPVLIRPAWIRARAPQGSGYERLLGLMRGLDLHTVCEEAHCPNLGECWSRGTATFMILGDVCTRACGFCAVKTGLPETPPDPAEARRVAEAVERMGLRHAVVTSVNRDDRADGGAGVFAATIAEIRARVPGCAVEVLIPDFKGRWDALQTVIDARPVFATPARFPDADEIVVAWPHVFLESAPIDPTTVVAVLTHDEKFDIPLLERALRCEAGYIGAMGSRSTHDRRVALLREAGLSADELGRLHSPIGLDLGARTPEETAVSILAEILAVRIFDDPAAHSAAAHGDMDIFRQIYGRSYAG